MRYAYFQAEQHFLGRIQETYGAPQMGQVLESAMTFQATGKHLLNLVMNIVVFIFTAAKAWIGVIGIGKFILHQRTVQKFVDAVFELGSNIGELRDNNQYLEETLIKI